MIGDPHSIMRQLEERSIPEPNSGCLLWLGCVSGSGYGGITVDGRPMRVHRVAWELANGPIPEGMLVCHKCDVRMCVNPDHLFLGTHDDNSEDKIRKGRHGFGERIPTSKLTSEDVLVIRQSGRPMRELAAQYGVHEETIRRVLRQMRWRHVDADRRGRA